MSKSLWKQLFMLVIAAALFCAGSVTASADEGSHSHPVCGAECTGHPDGTTHDTNVEFQPLSELTPYTGPSGYHYQIESGCYYLTQDLQLEENGSILITGHVTLCLNGKCLNWADGSSGSIYANAITIGEGCSLTICDCDGSQVHDYVCKKDETNYDYVELATETDEGAKSVTGGLIIGNGNPLLFVRDYAQLNLYGGNYVDGHKSWDLYGGLITYTYGAKVRLYGGYMEANCGAVGINCQGGGPDAGLYLYGGTLTGSCRRKIDVNGNFYLYGGLITDAPDAQWYDGFVWDDCHIYLISNAEDLNAFFELQFALDESDNNSWDARYEQYFSSNVTYRVADENGDPISFTANAFDMAGQEPCVTEAVFDGNNSPILFASETFRYGWAFIVYNCGEIKDLTLEYRNCTWDSEGLEEILFGGIVCENAGLIRNCGVRGSLEVVNSIDESDSDSVSFMYFGGIASVDLGVIQNCYSTLDLDARGVRFDTSTAPDHEYEFNFGGIGGQTAGFLYNCYAAGELNCDPEILALGTVLGGNYDQTCGIGTVVGSLITGAEPLLEWPGGWITYRDELAFGSNYGVGDWLIGTVIDLGTACDDWDLINTMSDMLDMYRYPNFSNATDEEFKAALEDEFKNRYGKTLKEYLDQALQVLYPDGQLAYANMVSALTDEDMQAETGLLRTLNGNREGHPQLAEWYLHSNENGGYPLLTPGNGSNSPSGGSGTSGGNGHSPALPGSVPGNVYAGDPFCNGGANCPIHHFADANTSLWYHKALDYVVVKGIMNGVGSDRFDPAGEFQRCMLVTMLARLDGVDTADGSTWYEKGVQWAMANGISDGTNPAASITREQIAAMLYRYAGLKGYDISARGDLTAFADGGKTSGWAIESMRWAVGCGILQGAGVHLDPTGTATRAEVAQMLMNFCRLVQTAA